MTDTEKLLEELMRGATPEKQRELWRLYRELRALGKEACRRR